QLERALLRVTVMREGDALAVLVEFERRADGAAVPLGTLELGDFPDPLQGGLFLLQGGVVAGLCGEHDEQAGGKRGQSERFHGLSLGWEMRAACGLAPADSTGTLMARAASR